MTQPKRSRKGRRAKAEAGKAPRPPQARSGQGSAILSRTLPAIGISASLILWGLDIPYFYAAAAAGIVIAGIAYLSLRSRRPTIVGLDVGHSAIKIVELSRGSNPTMLRYAITPTPLEAVADGVVRNRDALIAGLQDALAQSGIAPGEVITVMTGQTLVLQHLDFPRMREGELRQAVAEQVTAHVPMPAEEILYDYHQSDGGRDDMSRVLLVATQRDPVTTLVETLRDAGLVPTRVDIEPLAAYRAVFPGSRSQAAVKRQPRRAKRGSEALAEEQAATAVQPNVQVIVDLGAGTSNVSIYQDGVLQLQRVLRVAGQDLTKAVSVGMRVPLEEAEQLKREHGLAEDSLISHAIRPVAESLFREVRLSLEFFHSRNREVRFSDVVLIGGNARLRGMAEQLQEHLVSSLDGLMDISALRVYMPSSEGRIEGKGPAADGAEDVFPVLAVALGLALGEVDSVGSR